MNNLAWYRRFGLRRGLLAWVIFPWKDLIIGLAAAACGIIARALLDPFLGDTVPFITLFPAVAVAVYFAGARAGVLALALSIPAALWLFIQPRESLALLGTSQLAQVLMFIGAGGIIVAFGAALRAARRKLEQESRKRQEELEALVSDRTAKLREAVAELESFSHSVAHDLRTPLRAMKGFATTLREDHATALKPDGLNALVRIEKAAERLQNLIDDVLQYNRMLRSDLPLVPIALDQVIDEVVAAHPNLQPPNATINVSHPLPAVIGHEVALTQIISNLLQNAVKFVPPDTRPEVRISAERENGAVRLWIEDNGIGIPAKARDKLFQPFQRFEGSERYEGTGLGLAIVRKAVERLGGSAGVESAEGRGSRFWVALKPSGAAGLSQAERWTDAPRQN